jgi:hypothetical protein
MNRKALSTPYQLTFWGGLSGVRYTENHVTFEAAREEAWRVLALIDNRAAHPAIIDGPDLHRDGVTIP